MEGDDKITQLYLVGKPTPNGNICVDNSWQQSSKQGHVCMMCKLQKEFKVVTYWLQI